MSALACILDYGLFPFFALGPLWAAWVMELRGVPDLLVTPIVVGALVVFAAVLERLRPEWSRPLRRDIPLPVEAAHFICNFELGYGAALGLISLIERGMRLAVPAIWPAPWPLALQLVLAATLYEGCGYWQHRWLHRFGRIWPFHVLHHAGGYLDLVRAARFHCVDFFFAALMSYLPLVVLGAPDRVATLLAVLSSALGLAQHANIRMRTPRWLDLAVCTPAVHRRHHAKSQRVSNCNFSNTIMLWDHLFGSYGRPDPIAPAEIGVEEGPLSDGFWAQFATPFRRFISR